MQDRYNRAITYLRISVTDKCNLRCVYCMPAEGVPLLQHQDVLSFEEMAAFTRTAVSMGVTKVRLTGGEPLVRRDIVTLTRLLAAIDGITDLSMTTNGIRLAAFAQPLADAGLHRVNVSLDAVDPYRYAEITRGGPVREVFAGLNAAQAAGLVPIKLNCVIQNTPEEPDAQQVLHFGQTHGFEVRFIQRMHLATGAFATVIGGSGGDCTHCNRLRLTCDGMVRPCLFSNLGFDVRALGYREAIQQAVAAKPERGATSDALFHAIGG